MASTNKTAFFGLNQWVPDDMVKREDFNADNLAIDNALAAIPFRLITDHSVPTDTAKVSLDLSNVDLTNYRFLIVFASGKVDGSGFNDSECIRLRINDDSSSAYYTLDTNITIGSSETQTTATEFSNFMPSASSEHGGGGALARIYPSGDAIIIATEGMGSRNAVEASRYLCRYTGCSFQEIQSLVLSNFSYSTSFMLSGFHITVWGMGV